MSEQDLWLEVKRIQALLDELKTKDTPLYNIICKCNNSITISHTTTATWQAVALNTDIYDPLDMHNVSTNNTRVYLPYNGFYLISGGIAFAANTTGIRAIGIRIDGSEFTLVQAMETSSYGASSMNISGVAKVSANSYIELMGYQNSGGALDMTYVLSHSLFLTVIRIP